MTKSDLMDNSLENLKLVKILGEHV